MTEVRGARRNRASIRTLMIAVAVCAFLLAPVVWQMRHTEAQLNAERRAAESAALQAEKARYVVQAQAAQAALARAKLAVASQPTMGAEADDRQGDLWAALGVSRPIFKLGQTADLRIDFTLVNDGDQVIDPEIAESRIVINGKELADSGLILGNAPKDTRLKALPPGDRLEFGSALGNYFNEPGIYRVSWKGTEFQSPEIVVRIMAENSD